MRRFGYLMLLAALVAACGSDGGHAIPDAPVGVDANLPTFASQQTFPTGMSPSAVALGDLDGDTLVDAVVTNQYDSTICVLRGHGDGTFDACATYPAGYAPAAIAVADVSGDGKLDVIVAETGYYAASMGMSVGVYVNPGNGTFATRTSYGTAVGPFSIAARDLNGDGAIDLAIANFGNFSTGSADGTTISVLRNNGNGTFLPKIDYASGGTGTGWVAIGDVNGDGRPDLIAPNYISNTVGVLLHNTDATFATAVVYDVGIHPANVDLGDMDGDGSLDIVATNFGRGDGDTVSVLRNAGNGTFVPQPTVMVGRGPTPIRLADFNGDGRLDIAAGNVNANSVSIVMNEATGAFVPGGTLTVGTTPISMAAGDVNRDGKPDLVVTNANAHTISVLLLQ